MSLRWFCFILYILLSDTIGGVFSLLRAAVFLQRMIPHGLKQRVVALAPAVAVQLLCRAQHEAGGCQIIRLQIDVIDISVFHQRVDLGAAAVEAVETHPFNISGTGFEIALALVEA